MKNLYSKIIVALTLVFTSLSSFAQDETSLGAFIASPIASFKSTSIDDGGFAKQGWGLVFDSKTQLASVYEGLYFYSHSTYQWNDMNTDELAIKFSEYLGNKTQVTSSKYSPFLTTIGPALDVKLGGLFTLGINTGVGIIFNSTKAFTVKVYDNNNVVIANQLVNFDNNIAFAYNFGLELKMVVIKDVFSLALYSDYTGANQKTELTFTSADPVKSFQKLQYFNSGIRLVFKGKK